MTNDAVLTVEAMRAAEAAAMAAGTSEWELMQRAGQGAADYVWRIAAGRAVTVLCGPGNNGGDGYVIAESLSARGLEVTVVAPVEPGTDTAARARASYQGSIQHAVERLANPIMVDCLFGYGLSRPLEGNFAEVLVQAAASHPYRIAVDVPSGVASDSGALLGEVPQFHLTQALGAWKQAHFLMPALGVMGARRLVPIGLDLPDEVSRVAPRPALAPPPADAHKYKRGLLAIVAGAMPGAAMLAAQAALRSGAGYVKLLSDHSHPDAPAELVIEGGNLADRLSDERIGALLIGPGLGRDEEARRRLCAVLDTREPCVLDADALHLLDPDLLEGCDATRLLVTPHEGELAKLCDAFGIPGDGKLDRARALHEGTGLAVLAKGPDTILCGDGRLRFFPQASSWLSAAGTGDVLAGIAAARLATHGDPMLAAGEAVYLHREAAAIAAPAFTAGQLAEAVQPALERFL
ncbi:bifunctional ADP-dependent (S)-NAD(P)H-hydrate dehydratase/NAD(P)H-hydrate epimerase [Erythrobacter sp. QSSC1-22B]|uniref:bifunctional ADP-dependent NAD(P)H-hydrate dehydratase/NAD(P)H-hydrate epimerase n=1 Tax=Erythrobacter sp. QSSC1-22B TaxID=1860125 RepID=UPI0008051CAE|nr:bifunctional ADP-dependent NAD(P)H-hydrate dehydratase/NAD(P)H-hydrate epimerase [Erythrobacter sp. QSSC1-22B]OBX20363.1 bifunctional ADP-dependent (S)-NAD(P)H-hydrate dehydratase/NAD(P)H-hydrate epimerase [Erythrobacter sp. QSSC1-22B]